MRARVWCRPLSPVVQNRPFYVLSIMPKRQARNSGNRKEDVGWWDPNPGAAGGLFAEQLLLSCLISTARQKHAVCGMS